jgi:hypothetical protein
VLPNPDNSCAYDSPLPTARCDSPPADGSTADALTADGSTADSSPTDSSTAARTACSNMDGPTTGPQGRRPPYRSDRFSIDAMGCNPTIAQSILDAGADYLLAVKSLPPRRRGTTSQPFTPTSKAISKPRRPTRSRKSKQWTRSTAASRSAITPSPIRSIGMPQNPPIRAPRAFPSSPPSPWSRAASSAATRSKPNGDPISPPAPCRRRPSPRRRAAIGRSKTSHFALNLVRQVADKRSIKRRRKRASWDPQYLLEILGPLRR